MEQELISQGRTAEVFVIRHSNPWWCFFKRMRISPKIPGMEFVKRFTKDYWQALEKHDEFAVFQPGELAVTFDSKENLDRNYEGNLFYYFK
jgi:hypothetical protein